MGVSTDLFDLIGFRVVVKTSPTCYRALGAIHSQWKPMPKRFKDYISAPKPNGYQSLHTTVLGFGGAKLPTEIQIRTEKMHLDAEFGPAAHWAYKRSTSSNFDKDYVSRTSWFPDLLKDQDGLTGRADGAALLRRLAVARRGDTACHACQRIRQRRQAIAAAIAGAARVGEFYG